MAVSVIVRGPEWFFGIDSLFEGFAAIALLLVTLFSFKAYRFTKDKRYRTFAIAFGLMTVSILARAITDFLVYIEGPVKVWVLIVGYMLYMGATLASLILLFALTMKASQRAPFIALFLASLVLVMMSKSYRLSFHALSVILLAFIAYHFIRNYFNKKSLTALLVAGAFALLTLTHAAFIFDIVKQRFFVVGHLLHVAAFGLLLIALAKVLRNK
jgi:hypothetical protein